MALLLNQFTWSLILNLYTLIRINISINFNRSSILKSKGKNLKKNKEKSDESLG